MNTSFEALQSALRGRYHLDRELGRGGMGIVVLARDLALDRPVAIKLLPQHLAGIPVVRARFLQEARTAARLSHPHIVAIHAVEEHGDLVCFIMSYVPGETLAARVRNEGPLAPAVVTRLVQEVAWALAYAHQHGVIHRDIKPENILLERGSGRALVTDFGIARLAEDAPVTPGGPVMGTPRLVSPEQAAGELLDGRSDLYSLGVTAFFALTGRYPFEGDSAGQLLAQHMTVPAPAVATLRPGVPRGLATAVDRCLAKSPEQRFSTGEELAEAVAASSSVALVPRSLQSITREVSSFGVDLAGYGTLAGLAVLTQTLTRDFFGFGFNYTAGLMALLVSLLAIRGVHASRLIREAIAEGWTAADLTAAAEREARDHQANEQRRPPLPRTIGLYLAGTIALALFWLGPKQWVYDGSVFPIGLITEVLSLALPIALGRWLGHALEAPRNGRLGLLSRFFLRVKAGWLFKVLRWKLARPAPPPAIADQPTELALAGAVRGLLLALPESERRQLGGAEELLARLERDAAGLRRILEELDATAAEVGGGGSAERSVLVQEIADAQRAAAGRLASTLSALETLRLELLRVRARQSAGGNLTDDIDVLHRISDRIDSSLNPTPPG
ncbi:MAG: serine/threonine-protein kinase [Gemmatimonadota bacterium]